VETLSRCLWFGVSRPADPGLISCNSRFNFCSLNVHGLDLASWIKIFKLGTILSFVWTMLSTCVYVWCTWQLVAAIHGKGDGWTFWVTFSRSLLPLILVILVSVLSHSTTCEDFSVIS
jgi:heme exporter protein D